MSSVNAEAMIAPRLHAADILRWLVIHFGYGE